MRKSIKRNNPPKAVVGTAVAIGSAIASLIGTGISAYNAKKNANAQRREQEYQNALTSAQSMTDYMNQSQSLQDAYDRQNRMMVRCGGRRKMKYGGSNSSTGRLEQYGDYIQSRIGVKPRHPEVMTEVRPGMFFDAGLSHEQSDSKGHKGNDMFGKDGEIKFQEEGNEIVFNPNYFPLKGNTYSSLKRKMTKGGQLNEVRVLSSLPESGDGVHSAAELALMGENPNVSFNRQENKKMKNGSRKSIKKMSLGGWNENWGTSGLKYGDSYTAGLNLLVNTGNTIAALSGINDLKRPADLSLTSRSALPTRYSIGAQLGELDNAAARSRDYVNRNTPSSATARSANTDIDLNTALQKNQLYGTQQQEVNKLVSDNTRYLDEGRQNNFNLVNQHRKDLIDYANQKTALKTNALQTGFASISDTIDNLDKTINLRNQQDANMLASVMKSNPEGIKYTFAKFRPIAERLYSKKFVDEVLSSFKCGGRKSLKRK